MTEGDEPIAGEGDLVQRFLAPLARDLPGAFGLKDDCAVLTPRRGHDLVLTTDTIAEGVHFLPDGRPADTGWKALAVNVSDLAAKGAKPLVYLLSLSFPEVPAPEYMRRLARGLFEAQGAFGIVLAGGDTDRRPGPLTIAVTAIGEVPAGRLVRRGAARAGDRLYVSGTLGDAALGLRLRRDPPLERAWGLEAFEASRLMERYARPRPPVQLAEALRDHARAAMDISDGLAKDLGRMAAASGAGAHVELASIPLSPAAHRALCADLSVIESIVAGGDDYEVLAAVAPESAAEFEAAAAAANTPVTPIGRITAEPGVVIADPDGAPLQLRSTGWDHL